MSHKPLAPFPGLEVTNVHARWRQAQAPRCEPENSKFYALVEDCDLLLLHCRHPRVEHQVDATPAATQCTLSVTAATYAIQTTTPIDSI